MAGILPDMKDKHQKNLPKSVKRSIEEISLIIQELRGQSPSGKRMRASSSLRHQVAEIALRYHEHRGAICKKLQLDSKTLKEWIRFHSASACTELVVNRGQEQQGCCIELPNGVRLLLPAAELAAVLPTLMRLQAIS